MVNKHQALDIISDKLSFPMEIYMFSEADFSISIRI